jgi:hypothetical protein
MSSVQRQAYKQFAEQDRPQQKELRSYVECEPQRVVESLTRNIAGFAHQLVRWLPSRSAGQPRVDLRPFVASSVSSAIFEIICVDFPRGIHK